MQQSLYRLRMQTLLPLDLTKSPALSFIAALIALVFLAAVFVSNSAAIASAQLEETKSAELSPGRSISHFTATEMQIQPLPLPDLLLEPPALPGVEEAIARLDVTGMSTDAGDLLPNWGKRQYEAAQRAVRLGQVQPLPSNVAAATYIVDGSGTVSQATPTTSAQTPNAKDSATAQKDASPQSDRAQTPSPSDAAAGTDLRERQG